MIITLCGSALFEKAFRDWDEWLSLKGHVIFNLAVYPRDKNNEKNWYDEHTKIVLDLVHLHKITLSDAIVVLNQDKYVGESTSREISWARSLGKKIFWLEHEDQHLRANSIPYVV